MDVKSVVIFGLLVSAAFPVFSLYTGLGVSNGDAAAKIALSFVKNGTTYIFDGMVETLRVIRIDVLESYPLQYLVTIGFDSRHAGYGDRTGQVLLQVITRHIAVVKVMSGKVVSAVLDEKWDELNQREVAPSDEQPQTTVMSAELARDFAIKYVYLVHEEARKMVIPFSWKTMDLTPQGLVGVSKLQFTAEKWTVTIGWLVVREPTYTIEITYLGEQSFAWKGTVTSKRAVTEILFKPLS